MVGWQALAVAACLAGMASKEVMVSAPLMVLLYDRTFAAGSSGRLGGGEGGFIGGWRRPGCCWDFSSWHGRGGGPLASVWGRVVELCADAMSGDREVSLASFWPHPLILDYGSGLEGGRPRWRRRRFCCGARGGHGGCAVAAAGLGLSGGWFFVILAPSSSVLPLATQTSPSTGFICRWGRWWRWRCWDCSSLGLPQRVRLRGPLTAGLGVLTARRNEDYRSGPAIWSDTVAKCPGNARAHSNFGKALLEAGFKPLGLAQYREGLRLDPNNALVRFNLANALARDGRLSEAAESYEVAIRYHPEFADAHFHLAEVLEKLGRLPEAVGHYAAAVRLDPALVGARNNLGNILLALGRIPEAITQYEVALGAEPHSARLHYNLGNALAEGGKLAEAAQEYEAALQEQADYPSAQANLANTLFQLGRTDAAIAHYEAALRLAPAAADIHANFGTALLQLNRTRDAREQFEAALRIEPQNAQARDGLSRVAASPPMTGTDH